MYRPEDKCEQVLAFHHVGPRMELMSSDLKMAAVTHWAIDQHLLFSDYKASHRICVCTMHFVFTKVHRYCDYYCGVLRTQVWVQRWLHPHRTYAQQGDAKSLCHST